MVHTRATYNLCIDIPLRYSNTQFLDRYGIDLHENFEKFNFFSKIDVQSFGSFVKVYEVINLEGHLNRLRNYLAAIIIYKKTFQGNKTAM